MKKKQVKDRNNQSLKTHIVQKPVLKKESIKSMTKKNNNTKTKNFKLMRYEKLILIKNVHKDCKLVQTL